MQAQTQKREMAEDERMEQIRGFIDQTDWAGGAITTLRADASIRRFFRIHKGQKTAVLMDASPPQEDTAAYELMQKKLKRIGMTVPDIYAGDHARGLILMEDFGDVRYFELVTGGKADLNNLYALAVDALVHKFFADPAIALEESVAYSDD